MKVFKLNIVFTTVQNKDKMLRSLTKVRDEVKLLYCTRRFEHQQ